NMAPATVWRLDVEIEGRDPSQVSPALRRVSAALSDLRAGDAAPWCAEDRPKCVQTALDLSDHLRAVSAGSCEAAAMRGRILVEAGDAERALTELDAAADAGVDQQTCLRGAVLIAIGARLSARADREIERLSRIGCAESGECADNLVFAAEAELERGRDGLALAFFERAADRAPEREDLLQRIALLASRKGLHGEAAAAYKRLASRHPGDPRWSAAERTEGSAAAAEAIVR
ncbi:MAG: tetratricopeptide repeat protein, partial [Gemmatimonadales bacterium]